MHLQTESDAWSSILLEYLCQAQAILQQALLFAGYPLLQSFPWPEEKSFLPWLSPEYVSSFSALALILFYSPAIHSDEWFLLISKWLCYLIEVTSSHF